MSLNTFIYIKGCGIPSVDHALYESLQTTAHKHDWNDITMHIDQDYQPLFYQSGVCPIFEVMRHCDCELLLVAGAEHLSIDPEQLMKFNALLMEHDMRVYLQFEQQYLNEWVYEFKLLEA